jgi:hypothetical protein
MIKKIKEVLIDRKYEWSKSRSSKWPEVRKAHLQKNPTCSVCGSKEAVEVHHIKPFHIAPELELDESNLISLCESKKYGVNCHLFFGHLGNYKAENLNVVEDVSLWQERFASRKEQLKK